MTGLKRPTRQERGYDWAWYNLRKRHLAQQPNCTRCGARGVDVDHIVTIAKAPGRRLDPTNLRTYCHSCHSKVTQWNDNPTIERNPQRGATETGLPLDPTHPWLGGTAPPPAQPPWAKAARQDEIADEIF